MAQASSAQAAQAGLVAVMAADVTRAWSTVDVTQLQQSLPQFSLLVAAIVRRYAMAAATLAVRFYSAQRAAAGLTTPFTVLPAPPPPLAQVGATVRWAATPLFSATPDLSAAQRNLDNATGNLVLDTGRQTIVDNAHRDRRAKGWARIVEPGACAFCAMLALRGSVYKETTAGFKSHDNCRCHAEPVFTAYEPSAQVREWRGLYRTATAGVSGMKATQQAWRKAYEAHTA